MLIQLGTSTVTSLTSNPATLALNLPSSGGTLSFDDLMAGGQALNLGLGTGGSATGQIQAGSLLVSGSGGSASLTGSVAGQTGGEAAIASSISPAVAIAYQLNACEIGAADCGGDGGITADFPLVPLANVERPDLEADDLTQDTDLLVAAAVAARPPILTFDIPDPWLGDDGSDTELLLPNISDRDY